MAKGEEDDLSQHSYRHSWLVQDILQALPERDREILTSRFLLNLSVRETAVRMGLTEANTKVLQYHALKRAAHLEGLTTKAVHS